MSSRIERSRYHGLYGPTAGDRIRLGDTDLFLLIEKSYTSYGDEVLYGWGKNTRVGMMVAHRSPRDSELDSLISDVVVL
ncbi:MAG: urease subunit alpha, partial [Dehalococcoidia bacterium]